MFSINMPAIIIVTSLLTVLFAVLKLAGVLSWSWWVVLSPTLAMICFVFVVVVVAVVLAKALGH